MIARLSLAALVLIAATSVPATPAEAQPRQRTVEVFGDDPDPVAGNGEIIVIYRRPESDRYRIPTELREGSIPGDREAADARVDEMVYVGRTGTQSCSPVGPGGFTGCHEQLARQWREEKRQRARAAAKEPN